MFATVAPLPTPPHVLDDGLDAKAIKAMYTIFAVIADPETHKKRLDDLVAKHTALRDFHEQIKSVRKSLDDDIKAHNQKLADHAAFVADHDAEHKKRMDALVSFKEALDDQQSKLAERQSTLDKAVADHKATVENTAAVQDETLKKRTAAERKEKALAERESRLAAAENDYQTRVDKLKQFVGL